MMNIKDAFIKTSKVMGLDPDIVPYFNFMKEAGIGQGQQNKIKLIGNQLNDSVFQYKPERSFDKVGLY